MDETVRWRIAYDTISALVVSIEGSRNMDRVMETCSLPDASSSVNRIYHHLSVSDQNPTDLVGSGSYHSSETRTLQNNIQIVDNFVQSANQNLGGIVSSGLVSLDGASNTISNDVTTISSGHTSNIPVPLLAGIPSASLFDRIINDQSPTLFRHLLDNFYRETFLWLYTNILLHPGSRRTRNRLMYLAADTGQSLHQVTHNLLTGYLTGFQVGRAALMQQVDVILSDISTGQLSAARATYLRQLSVEVGAVLSPRQMLKSFSTVVVEVITRITSQRAANIRSNNSQSSHSPATHSMTRSDLLLNNSGNYHSQALQWQIQSHLGVDPSISNQSWRSIPSPPPPYPSFMLHFLSIIGNPPTPVPTSTQSQEIPANYGLSEAESYDSLWELAERLGEVRTNAMLQEDINQLPVHLYSELGLQQTDVHFQNKCVICLYQFDKDEPVRGLPCAHQYHVDCIDRWLRIKGNCPLCRCDIKSFISSKDTA